MAIQSGNGMKWWHGGLPFQTVPQTGKTSGAQKYWFNGLPMSPYAVVASDALSPSLFADADVIAAPVIAGTALASSLSPSPVAADDALYAPSGISQIVLPALVSHPDTFANTSISADLPGHGRQTARPGLVSDADSIKASAIGASVKPNSVPSDDAIYPVASITAARGTAFVPSDDAVYAFTTTRFVLPSLVPDADMIPFADVGWKVFAEFTADADAVYSNIHIDLINYMLPNVLAEDDVIDTYPFFLHGLTGGVPLPKPIGLTGSLSQPRRLKGSLSHTVRLKGSIAGPRRLTGSIATRIGTGKKR